MRTLIWTIFQFNLVDLDGFFNSSQNNHFGQAKTKLSASRKHSQFKRSQFKFAG